MKGDSSTLLEFLLFAIPAADPALGLQPRRQAVQHYYHGRELMAAERYDDAAREFSTAIGLDPLLTLAHYGLGQALMAQRQYASAVAAFIGCQHAYAQIATLAARSAPDEECHVTSDSHQSPVSAPSGDVDTADATSTSGGADAFQRTRVTGDAGTQTPPEVSLALGSAYYRNGQQQDAEREWKAAVAADPRLGEAYNNLAALYATTGRKQEAEHAVRAAERAKFRVKAQLKADIAQMD